MTETDELRRLLDEAGVEWHDDGYATTCTVWTANGITWHGLWRDSSIELLAHHLTPAQAIAATVGRGTCHDAAGKQMAFFACSVCGGTTERKHPRFCPNCGARIEVDG